MDQMTAFVDASTVYGSNENETDSLRSFVDGELPHSSLKLNLSYDIFHYHV